MKVIKKRCAGCRKWFSPNPRTIRNSRHSCQRYCSEAACRKAYKKDAQVKWLARNPNYFKGNAHKGDCQNWAREHPDYWKNYRARRPAYVEINRQKQRIRDRRRSFLAKKDAIAKNPVEHLEDTRLLAQKNLAKKDLFRLPVERILDFLEVKEFLAKKDVIASGMLIAA